MTAPQGKFPMIAIVHDDAIPAKVFAEFRDLVEAEGLDLLIDGREASGPSAGIEWLLPTAVVVFVGKTYFESFLKEAGKDHYAMLKAGLSSLYKKFVGPDAPAVTVVSSAGKRSGSPRFSMLFSVLAEGNDGVRFKLLIEPSASREQYEASVRAFLSFLDDYHAGVLEPDIQAELSNVRVVGRTLLLAFDADLDRVRAVDPLAK